MTSPRSLFYSLLVLTINFLFLLNFPAVLQLLLA